MLSKGDCPDLTRRDFVQIGASVVAVMASSKVWSSNIRKSSRN
jgi:hypothetical protein